MKRRILLLIFTALLIAVVFAAVMKRSPHDFSERECPKCHIDYRKNPAQLVDPMTTLCKHCHRKVIRVSSHPVDITPRRVKIPSDLPLRNGKITCATCHSIHADAGTIFGKKTYMLRRPTSDMKYFCVSCHEEDTNNPGHLLTALAHTGNRYQMKNPEGTLDALSLECIGCHDGQIAKSGGMALGEGEWEHMGGSHPVGVDYNLARMNGSSLAPMTELSKKIRFFEGKIGCGTCHDMYSPLPAKLVMTNNQSRLCRDCHYTK